MNDYYLDQQIIPDITYRIKNSYAKLKKRRTIEIFILLSIISIIGLLWVWLLAFWWLISFRGAEKEFITVWKDFPYFEANFPFKSEYHDLITNDKFYQQKLQRKNSVKSFVMLILAIPVYGWIIVFTVSILTFGVIFVIYYYQMQIPIKYLSYKIASGAKVQDHPIFEKGIICERCGKDLPKRARYCDTCAYPVNIPQQKEVAFQRISFRQAIGLLDSETYPRGSRMDIEFESLVLEPASPEEDIGPSPHRKIRITDPGQFVKRTLYIWGDLDRRHNIDLAASLEKGDRILIIGPSRPKDDSRYYKDENGQDVFWITSWNGTALGSGTRLLKLQVIPPKKVEEPLPHVKSKDVIEFSKETPLVQKDMLTPPFYCQLCSIKHTAGTPRMQCDSCGRFVCIEAFAEMAQVGRTNCPMCDGKLISM
ncbi:MAG: hypothetical protein ACXAC8_13215 [Candidatus Hodarchaeales archaeon]|jgi:ribosomal protein L40E